MIEKQADNFSEAIAEASDLHNQGFVGISLFNRGASEGITLYVIYAYYPFEWDQVLKDRQAPEEPLPPFEVTNWKIDDDGDQYGEQMFVGNTLGELLENIKAGNRVDLVSCDEAFAT